jgi:uncharacterized delta-60 repeat protein
MVVAVVLLLVVAGAAIAAPTLDPRFGEEGVVRTPLSNWLRGAVANSGKGPLIEDLALQRDGKIVAALASGGETPFVGAARYRPNGRLDRSFGPDGFAEFEREHLFRGVPGAKQGQAVAVQRDGKILIVGYRNSVFSSGWTAPLLLRLRPNGKPDRSFGSRGLVAPRPREKDGAVLHGVAVQRNGRIVAVGARNERRGGKPAGLVIAYRPDGRVDRRFGRNGRVAFPHRREFSTTSLRDIVVLPSGKMLVVGYLANRLFVARLWPNGGLDRSFGGGDGKVIRSLGLTGCCSSRRIHGRARWGSTGRIEACAASILWCVVAWLRRPRSCR